MGGLLNLYGVEPGVPGCGQTAVRVTGEPLYDQNCSWQGGDNLVEYVIMSIQKYTE
jgi:hypothetical protein